jgi:hypothetical protein
MDHMLWWQGKGTRGHWKQVRDQKEMVAGKRAQEEANQRPENQVEDPEGEGDDICALFYLRNGGMEEGTVNRSETRKPGGRPRRRMG